jgi:hypothetical protein
MKIYDGFKLPEKWNNGKISTFQQWCDEVKLIVEKEYNKEYSLSLHRFAIVESLNHIYSGTEYNIIETMKYVNENLPLPGVALYFFEGKIYGSTFTSIYSIRAKLMEKGYIEDFAYWDNTDPDENISKKEWKERERVWDSIDHWQVSLQFQDYLLRSSFYLDDDERKELKKQFEILDKSIPERWLKNQLEVSLNKEINNANTPIDYKAVRDLVEEILKDDYKGQYLSMKINLLKVIEKYNANEKTKTK